MARSSIIFGKVEPVNGLSSNETLHKSCQSKVSLNTSTHTFKPEVEDADKTLVVHNELPQLWRKRWQGELLPYKYAFKLPVHLRELCGE